MLIWEILKLRFSEIAGNVYFSIHFCMLKISRRVSKLHEKGDFPESLKSRGHVPPVPPVPTSMPKYVAHFKITLKGKITVKIQEILTWL